MNSYLKTAIKSLVSITFIFGVIIAYGFIIGGYTTLWFYLIITICTILSILFIFGKKFFSKSSIPIIVLVVSVTCLISNCIYMFINNTFDSVCSASYISEITDGPGSAQFEIIYYFSDPDGNEKCYERYYLFFEYPKYDIGDAVYVEEYKGTFGIEHYKLTKQ